MQLVFATQNSNKSKEIRELLPNLISLQDLGDINCYEDIPETSPTIEGNAVQKAEYVLQHYGHSCFADDTGLEIEALNNEPGVYSARYAGPEKNSAANITKVLTKLEGESNRNAQFRTVIALATPSGIQTFEGICKGTIGMTQKGTDGFGYDPIFIPEGEDRTFAEMSLSEKNRISHRSRAFQKFVAYVNSLSNG